MSVQHTQYMWLWYGVVINAPDPFKSFSIGMLMDVVLAFLFGPASPFVILLPMMIYTLGVGLVMPQSMAGAMSPFPQHAGAASSMLGLTQMIFAASTGLLLGHLLEHGVWPLPAMIACLGVAALCRFRFTRF